MSLSEYIQDIELAINARDMREPIARALEELNGKIEDIPIDEHPIENSENLVSSGGVYEDLQKFENTDDIHFPTDEAIFGEKVLIEQGTYSAQEDGFDGYSQVIADQSIGKLSAKLEEKHIYLPGVYDASDDECDGYSLIHASLNRDNELLPLIERTISSISDENDYGYIGSYAFYGCTQLTSVAFPVCTNVGRNAFEKCYNLTMVSALSCSSWQTGAFSDCYQLSVVRMSRGTNIPDYFCYNCSEFFTLELPYESDIMSLGFGTVGSYAFYNCKKFLGFGHFNPNTTFNLRHEYIPGEEYEIMLPLFVNSVGDYAFYNCKSLTYDPSYMRRVKIKYASDLDVQSSKTIFIGSHAFENCIAMHHFYISNYTSEIIDSVIFGDYAFANCTFAQFYIYGQEPTFQDPTSSIYIDKIFIGKHAFANIGNVITDLYLFQCKQLIFCDEAFRGISVPAFTRWEGHHYSSGVVPMYIASVGKYAFQSAYPNRSYYTIPVGGGTSEHTCIVDEYAYDHCSALTKIHLYNCILSTMAFGNCTELSKVYFDSVGATCGEYTFANCSKLSTVLLGTGNVTITSTTFINTPLELYDQLSSESSPRIFIESSFYSYYLSASYWSLYSKYMRLATRLDDYYTYDY